jgi:hypothetical protein
MGMGATVVQPLHLFHLYSSVGNLSGVIIMKHTHKTDSGANSKPKKTAAS